MAVAAIRRLKLVTSRMGLDRVLASEPARAVRKQLFKMRFDDLTEIAKALTAGGVEWWLTGGWGVDALLGEQTRTHEDVDVCVNAADDGERRAIASLRNLGYEVVQARARGGSYLPVRVVLRNQAGRAIDLLMVQTEDGGVPADAQSGWDVPVFRAADLTVGQIDGRRLPALSVAAQLNARSVYEPAPRDHRDVARLCAAYDLSPPPSYRSGPAPRYVRVGRWLQQWRSAGSLIIAVPEAQDLLDQFGRPDDAGLPPHITILYPFKKARSLTSSDRERLAELAARTDGPFRYRLTSISDFEGSLYAGPEPSGPFINLTQRAQATWPDYPPYGGEFAEIVPHLSLGVRDLSPVELERAKASLPIDAVATELLLLVRSRRGRWSTSARYPLGASAERGP